MITVKAMQPEDVPFVAALEKECFSMPWPEEAVALELKNPLSCWLVAYDGQDFAGYVGSQAVLDEADMMNLAVMPNFRRRGIAGALVIALVERLKEKGVLVRHFKKERLKDYTRITIGSREQIDVLIDKLKEILKELL